MSKKKFNSSIPREMFWSNEVQNKRICPNCYSRLEKEYHVYLMVIRARNNYEYFVTGNDDGYFCPNCKVVVLDYDKFAEIASAGKPDNFSDSFKFAVLGIVDTDAVPEEKENIPLGTDDNPVPLVEFTNLSRKGPNKGKKALKKKRKLAKIQRRKRRK